MAYTANDLPQICTETGLDCTSCTSSTAKELARACPGLPAKLVAQLFVQIHTYSACARMHRNFASVYDETMTERSMASRLMSKGPAIELQRPLTAAAAA